MMSKYKNNTHKTVSLAPMMGYTDHYFRLMLRLLSPDLLLFTEMVTAQALVYGGAHTSQINNLGDRVIFQVGGGDPLVLGKASKIIESLGYSGINLNVGCPSNKVNQANIGACLMLQPKRVADCIKAMSESVSIPVSIKCRVGVDGYDDFAFLKQFIEQTYEYTDGNYYIHARKAILKGLNPKQNRSIPPLNYDRVCAIKNEFSNLCFHLNGGINNEVDFMGHISDFDGVMIGRWFCRHPYEVCLAINSYYGVSTPSRDEVLEKYIKYVSDNPHSSRWQRVVLPLQNLYKGLSGARKWRVCLSESKELADIKGLL